MAVRDVEVAGSTAVKAIVYEKSIPRYVAMKLAGSRRCGRSATGRWGLLCPVSVRKVAAKPFPTGEWVRVSPRMSGICGSDLSVICGKGSTYFSPLTSVPFVLGHEVVGEVVERGVGVSEYERAEELSELSPGARVALEPALGCRVRGIRPVCAACARGHAALCRNVTRGSISAGIQTGYCRDTSGGWSSDLVCHRSQLHAVPDAIEDRAAVLTEPLACALHGVMKADWRRAQSVFVLGCGTIGLLTIAALRFLGCESKLIASAKYAHQRRLASALGADVVIDPPPDAGNRTAFGRWLSVFDAEAYYPELGPPTILGGVDLTFECIATSASLDLAIRVTTGGGTMVLLGMPGVPRGVDWTAIWFKSLTIHAAYAYGAEPLNGSGGNDHRPSCALALDMLATWGGRLTALVGRPYDLEDYRGALQSALFTGRSETVKTVFGFHP